MPSITLQSPFIVDRAVLSPLDLIRTYFFGIDQLITNNERFSDKIIADYIRAAQQELEDELDIKIFPTIIKERSDFDRKRWQAWGYIPTRYPVKKAFALEGFVNTVRQVTYPTEWLSTQQLTGHDQYYRQIFVVPNGSDVTSSSSAVIYTGITPHLGFDTFSHIPNYWEITYCTGFSKPPAELVNFIGKLASINIFHVLGDLILGAGIASQSIGIDGLSQSISTTSSATNAGYGARITGYVDDLKKALPSLKAEYQGWIMDVL